MNEPVFNPGDRVRIIDAPLPAPYRWRWGDIRPGMEGVVTDGPLPFLAWQTGHALLGVTAEYRLYTSLGAKVVISVLLEKLDGPPPEESDLPELEPYDALI